MIQEDFLNKTDQELVTLTLKEKEHYGFLIQRYEEKLKRYIVRLSGGRVEDANDVLQEVFIKVYRNLNGYDHSLKFSSWIYRIAHNETITFLRKINRKPTTYNFDIDAIQVKTLKEDLNIEKEIDKKRLAYDVAKVISRLNPKYKDVLSLRYVEDKDYKEISDILKKPAGTVATLLRQAKEEFKKEILKDPLINGPDSHFLN